MSRDDRGFGAFPKPGPALKWVLGVVFVVGILEAILSNWAGHDELVLYLACIPAAVLHGQVWRLLTAGLLTDTEHYGHLLFTLIGLYFLSTDLERRWGPARFLRFLGISVTVGYTLAVLADLLAPASIAALHIPVLFGASAALTATSIAWSRANTNSQVLLFFVMPVSGRSFFWLTIGYCVLGVIYPPASMPSGMLAPFGGVLTGILLAGDPSPARRAYLRLKLALLQGRGGRVPTAHEIAFGTKPARHGRRPPLRVVQGGQADDPPKDKRYLN